MTDFPVAAYRTNASRTVGDIKAADEDWLQATKETLGGAAESVVPTVTTIDIDSTVIRVNSGGAATVTDITSSTLPTDGRCIIVVRRGTATSLTMVHNSSPSSGEMTLRGGVNFVLDDDRYALTLNRNADSTWTEVGRFEMSSADTFTWLGLGNAALYGIGAGSLLDADKLDGVEGAGYLLAAGTAADSSLLDSLNSTDFMQLASAGTPESGALQTVAGAVRVDGSTITGFGPSEVNVRLKLDGVTQTDVDRVHIQASGAAPGTEFSHLAIKDEDDAPVTTLEFLNGAWGGGDADKGEVQVEDHVNGEKFSLANPPYTGGVAYQIFVDTVAPTWLDTFNTSSLPAGFSPIGAPIVYAYCHTPTDSYAVGDLVPVAKPYTHDAGVGVRLLYWDASQEAFHWWVESPTTIPRASTSGASTFAINESNWWGQLHVLAWDNKGYGL